MESEPATMATDDAEPNPSWVVRLRTSGNKPSLFCACALGGDAFDYRDLAAALPEDQPVYAFGVPDCGDGELFPKVRQIAEACAIKVRELQKNGPYYLCGHSFGGLVAYEMAAVLAQDGCAVELVALLDTEHPAYRRILPLRQKLKFHFIYFLNRTIKYGRNLGGGHLGKLRADVLRFVRGRAHRLTRKATLAVFGALDQELPNQIRSPDLLLSGAWHAYTPPEYQGRVVLFLAADRSPEYAVEPTLGWKTCASKSLELQTVPGDHLSLLHPPFVASLAEALAGYLGAAEATGETRS